MVKPLYQSTRNHYTKVCGIGFGQRSLEITKEQRKWHDGTMSFINRQASVDDRRSKLIVCLLSLASSGICAKLFRRRNILLSNLICQSYFVGTRSKILVGGLGSPASPFCQLRLKR